MTSFGLLFCKVSLQQIWEQKCFFCFILTLPLLRRLNHVTATVKAIINCLLRELPQSQRGTSCPFGQNFQLIIPPLKAQFVTLKINWPKCYWPEAWFSLLIEQLFALITFKARVVRLNKKKYLHHVDSYSFKLFDMSTRIKNVPKYTGTGS